MRIELRPRCYYSPASHQYMRCAGSDSISSTNSNSRSYRILCEPYLHILNALRAAVDANGWAIIIGVGQLCRVTPNGNPERGTEHFWIDENLTLK